MKKKAILVAILSVLMVICAVVAGCESLPHSHNFGSNWKSNEEQHWRECSCGEKCDVAAHVPSDWIVDTPATVTSEGAKHTECTVCLRILETKTISQLSTDVRTVNIYAINDFHGTVNLMPKVGGYLADRRNADPNTVLLNSGDMFQGSLESNSNYGRLLTDCMDEIGFDGFTFGNHEFDWGLNKLQALAEASKTPFLGANIYHWNADDKTWGTFADELAQEYAIKVLDNGLKVGIIGVIGKDQITSISSNLVQTIGFKNPAEIIPSLSNKLRNQLDCDVVLVSAHTEQATFLEDYSFDITQYCDAVFCAHSHQEESAMVNSVPFIQGGSNGRYVSNVTLKVAPNGDVTCSNYTNISYSNYWKPLPTVETLVNDSNAKIADEANQVLATSDGKLNKYEALPRLVCNAVADYAVAQNHDIALAMVNNARSDINGGNINYTTLYKALPFDNEVYIAKVSGADILKELGYGSITMWRVTEQPILYSSTTYYKVAVIDYLLFHQNSNREYNYFKSAFRSGFTPVPLQKEGYDIYNYRQITRDFMLDVGSISSKTYTEYNPHTDISQLESEVSFGTYSNGKTIRTQEVAERVAEMPFVAYEASSYSEYATTSFTVSECVMPQNVTAVLLTADKYTCSAPTTAACFGRDDRVGCRTNR